MISQAQLKFLSPLVQITPCPKKLNMHITGMGRFFRHIAHLNALQFTPKRKRERRTDQNSAFHGPKILLAHFFCIAHYDLESFLQTILFFHSTPLAPPMHSLKLCLNLYGWQHLLGGGSLTPASALSSDCVWLCARPPSPAGPWSSAPSRCWWPPVGRLNEIKWYWLVYVISVYNHN